MNILIPDSWLREYLKTNAKPEDVQRCLSLCGPSIERTEKIGGDVIYDIEVTTNRVDSFSVYGIAREAAAILPEFGFRTKLLPLDTTLPKASKLPKLDIRITDPEKLCRRILAIKISNVKLTPSPKWMSERLEKVGQRPLNNIIDITNYVMWETGLTSHAFDYDRLTHKTILVRSAKKGERLITLDFKRHTLRGGELVFDDGTGIIIDLPSIMGTSNSVITNTTKNVLLLVENADPAIIRYGSMGLGIRTQAATINEKGLDVEGAYTSITRVAKLATKISGGTFGSTLFDHYPAKQKPASVSVSHEKLCSYLGTNIEPKRVITILSNLGFSASKKENIYHVTPPSWRASDCQIPEDVIEEVARIYGYHNINTRLPEGEPPVAKPNAILTWEEDIKIRLRDWGFTELLTYSMISEKQMDIFGFDKEKAYKIQNPLSNDWEYMRPHAIASTLPAFVQNLNHTHDLKAFELTMSYLHQPNDLPKERPVLNVLWSGDKFIEAKGMAETLFTLFGIPFQLDAEHSSDRYTKKSLKIGDYASMGILKPDFLKKLGTDTTITRLYMNIENMIRDAKPIKQFIPIPKYPPIVEDLSFIVPERFAIGPLIAALKSAHPLVASVELLDVHENSRTLHITYQDPKKNLTDEEVEPIRQKLIDLASNKFGLVCKTANPN